MPVGKTVRNSLPFSNVIATGDATSNIATGKTIANYQLKLAGTALTKAMITTFKMRANGKVIFEGSAIQIDKIQAYRGRATNVAYLDISFEDLTGLDIVDRVVGCLDTSVGIPLLTTELSIAGATAPVLSAQQYEQGPQLAANGAVLPFAGTIAKQLRYSYSVAAGGTLPLQFPFGPQSGAVIKRVHIFQNTGNMTGATVKEDGIEIYKSLVADNVYELTRMGRVPQALMYTIDFMPDGDTRKAFDTTKSRSVEWLLDFSAADAGFVVIEYLDHLGNL